jgi:hypothetical protein
LSLLSRRGVATPTFASSRCAPLVRGPESSARQGLSRPPQMTSGPMPCPIPRERARKDESTTVGLEVRPPPLGDCRAGTGSDLAERTKLACDLREHTFDSDLTRGTTTYPGVPRPEALP